MRGRKPKPTVLKLLDGNPGKRTINDREPARRQGIPEMPAGLERRSAKAEWNRIVPEFGKWACCAGRIGRRWPPTAPLGAAGATPKRRS